MEQAIAQQANDCLARKEWAKAAEIFNQLLLNTNGSVDNKITYLFARSECFLELEEHEAVIADCRKLINLLGKSEEHSVIIRIWCRLIISLCALYRLPEAELALREVLSTNNGFLVNLDAVHLMERLATVVQGGEQTQQLRNEMLAFENKLQALHSLKNSPSNQPFPLQSLPSCTFCNLSFRDKPELKAHCQTEGHQMVIMSDEGRDWQCRPPPRGVNSESYRLCEYWNDTGSCRLGAQCIDAHGGEELVEWKERFEYRHMKLQRAYEKELYGKSYIEEFLEKWIQAPCPEKMMREKIEEVEDHCSIELVTTVSSKTSVKEWKFNFITNKSLCAVALLHDAHRNHFELKDIFINKVITTNDSADDSYIKIDIKSRQEWTPPFNSKTSCSNGHIVEYIVIVGFKTNIFGTFRQSVVFDFGFQPVLVKNLCVDVVPAAEVEKIKEIRQEIILFAAKRWDINNSEIIPYTSQGFCVTSAYNIESDWGKQLITLYPCPLVETFTLTHATIAEKKLTQNNYKARMHELLYIEEMARNEQVSKYNLTAKLHVVKSYLLSPNGVASTTAKYSNFGELFAFMNLGQDLSEDTLPGRLILNNCISVLLAPEGADNNLRSKRKVYEALIEDKGKNVIYLRLSATTVNELGMLSDCMFEAQIQFQLNRIPYCEWHYAVDKIADLKLIFPDTYIEPNIPWTPQLQWSETIDSRLNLKQKEAVVAITTPIFLPLPPILIIGPFGTGKTFTLAQAIKQLLMQANTRILVCTHSNSAADLYIKDYLHAYVESGHKDATPLRIYYQKRWVTTVHPTVQKYCLIDESGGQRQFRVPTAKDLKNHRITVVTLSTSIYLSSMGLPQGFFTHILLDEAAQAMECEAVMPLSLANKNTRIVLAGDHMQLSPELYSQFTKDRNLHVSLLERLYDYYPALFPCKILLCENYRAHEAIIKFTSELFYEQKLVSSGKQPRHDKFYPLTFFTAMGEDIQDQNSTAFYNNSEAYEVIERVCELRKLWPHSWGKIDDQSIGIMTPYADQVFRIRSELRKRRMGGISVERVLNVQGKQFRAVFLSTVRTRRTCVGSKTSEDADFGFLSNSKLLNTAITRAQSLVAVVGDPVALCSVGRCSKVWETFIQICNQNKSLFGITWSYLKNQLDGLELKKTYGLNPLAPEFVPRRYKTEKYIKVPPRAIPYNNGFPVHSQPYSHPRMDCPVPNSVVPIVPPMFYPPYSNNNVPRVMVPVRPPVIHPMAVPSTVPPETLQSNWNSTQHSPNLPHSSPSVPMAHNNYPLLPPHRPVFANMPHSFVPPPRHLPPEITQQQRELLSQLEKNPEMNPEMCAQKRELIQFLDNVHFPETIKETNVANTASLLNDFMNLLPQDMSLAEVLIQPRNFHEHWFCHLRETKGMDAARKFQYLIATSTKKDHRLNGEKLIQMETQTNSLITRINGHISSLSTERSCRNNLMTGQIILHDSMMDVSYLEQQTPNLTWFDKPANQINFDKPVYLRDLMTLARLQSLQNQEEATGIINHAPYINTNPFCPNPMQSVPLYKRLGPPNNIENGDPSNAMQMIHRVDSNMQVQNQEQQHWQQQINADFASLSINNKETVDEMLENNSVGPSYASVLKLSNKAREREINYSCFGDFTLK